MQIVPWPDRERRKLKRAAVSYRGVRGFGQQQQARSLCGSRHRFAGVRDRSLYGSKLGTHYSQRVKPEFTMQFLRRSVTWRVSLSLAGTIDYYNTADYLYISAEIDRTLCISPSCSSYRCISVDMSMPCSRVIEALHNTNRVFTRSSKHQADNEQTSSN